MEARFETIWVLRTVCGHSLAMIGGYMGGRDHTTILNSINKISLQIATKSEDRARISALCEEADTLGVIQNRLILLRQAQ